MEYKKSHNDYWSDKPVFDAILNCCNIIEADIIWLRNDLMCSHSWRPFKCMCHDNLINYLHNLKYFLNRPSLWNKENLEDAKLFVQIEFKTVNKKSLVKLYDILKEYKDSPLLFLICGGSFMGRDKIAKQFCELHKDDINIVLWDEWKKDKQITTIDLYTESFWKF